MCHVNMLKGYHVRDNTKPVLNQNTVASDVCDENENPSNDFFMNCDGCDIRVGVVGMSGCRLHFTLTLTFIGR